MPADVCVIMPAYRSAATIARALASIAAQTVRPRRVIVVDDCSPDDSAARAEACRALLAPTELTVLRQERNLGAGAARNRALAAADDALVAFLDADDQWLPAKLERSLAVMTETGADLVCHDMIIDDHGRESVADCARHGDARDPFRALFVRGFVATSTVVARREALVAAGGFDAALPSAQDYDLWLAVAGSPGRRLAIFAEALTRWHVTPGSITTHIARRLACNRRILARHAPTLRRRPGSVLRPVIMRWLVIHYEAVSGLWRQGKPGAATIAALEAPFALVAALAAPWRAMNAVLALWVLAAMAAYLAQFADIGGRLLAKLGAG